MSAQRVHIERRVEGAQAGFVDFNCRLEELELRAPQDHPHVDELLTLDARDNAYHRVVIGTRRGHGWLPQGKGVAPEGGRKDSRRKSVAVDLHGASPPKSRATCRAQPRRWR